MEDINVNAALDKELDEGLDNAQESGGSTDANAETQKRGCAKEFLTQLLSYMGADCSVEEKPRRDELCYYIKGNDAHRLIGYRGEGLDALQHLAMQVAKSSGCTYERVVVDADFYRQKREATLGALAKKLARKAAMQGRPVALEPMNASERRMMHSALQGSKLATTHSEGEGRARHIVITPIEGASVEPTHQKKAGETVDATEEMSYGSSSFNKKGPKKTRSFGYNKKRF